MLHQIIENKINISKISKDEIAKVTELELDYFNFIDGYSKKSNANSLIKLTYYNELLIAKLNAETSDSSIINNLLYDFELCDSNVGLIDSIDSHFRNYNISWLDDFNSPNLIWYKRLQQFEDLHIKSSVTLYFIKNQNTNDYYIILDQTDV